MANYDLVIFDMDGTLLDSGNAHQEMFARYYELYFPEFEEDIIYKHKGKTILEALETEGVSPRKIGEMFVKLDEFYNLMAEDIISGLRFTPEGVEIIGELRENGVKTALVTNSMASLANQIVAHNDAEFDYVVGARPDTQDKQAYFKTIMEEAGAPKARTLYVGDAEVDVDVAKKSGIDCCIVYTPMTWLESAEGLLVERDPDFVIKDIRRLGHIVLDRCGI